MAEELAIVGKSLTKPDAYPKVTGQTKFADDLALPRMIYGRILRSPYPHARILNVDTSRARALPGVLAVLTGDDLPIKFGILPVSQDEEALAREKVRYVGDPIAAVAATDEWVADEALDLIDVEFAELPGYMTIEEAIAGRGEPIHGTSNVHKAVALEFGDTDEAMARADQVREEIFYAHRGRHPVQMKVKTGFSRDGRITAMQFQSFLDGGGYGSYGVATTYYTGALQTTTYAIPRYRFEGVRLFTNKPPCGPKRGHGTPQPRFALEVHLDKVAEELGIDPVEIRRRNLTKANSRTVNWLRITSCGLEQCINKVVEASRFPERGGSMPAAHGLCFAAGSYWRASGTA